MVDFYEDDILIRIDFHLLKGESEKALNLFTKFLCKYRPGKKHHDIHIFTNLLATLRIWPENKNDINCIIIRTLIQRRLAIAKDQLVLEKE